MHFSTETLFRRLCDCRHFNYLANICCNESAYVVGGAVRDAFIGAPVKDIDLVFPEDPTMLAKEFAQNTGGHWFWLDQSRLQSRVVFKPHMQGPGYDFAPFRAPDLLGDLCDRDFTVNAVALDLYTKALIDPFNGLRDCQKAILRMVSDDTLVNDPLRIIKGVRHASCLGFEIAPMTLKAMQDNVFRLEQVAVERVRQEAWKILSDKNIGTGLMLLDASRVGQALFGEEYATALQGMVASTNHYQKCWDYLAGLNPVVNDWLNFEVEQGLSRRTLLLFLLLLQQVDSGLPEKTAEHWLLSRKAKSNITALASIGITTLNEFALVARNPRALFWWSSRNGAEVKLLMLYLACCNLLDRSLCADVGTWLSIVEQVADERLHDLIYGRWLSESLGIEEGPEMSRALSLLRNAEISGEVSNEEEARVFLSRVYLDSD